MHACHLIKGKTMVSRNRRSVAQCALDNFNVPPIGSDESTCPAAAMAATESQVVKGACEANASVAVFCRPVLRRPDQRMLVGGRRRPCMHILRAPELPNTAAVIANGNAQTACTAVSKLESCLPLFQAAALGAAHSSL